MKAVLVFFHFLIAGNCFTQESTSSQIEISDSTEFGLFYHKKYIPNVFYRIDGIKPRKLVNPTREFTPGCINPIRGQLNWVAKKGKNRVVCITKGSSAVITIIYFLDYSSGKLSAYSTTGPVGREITFGEFLALLQTDKLRLEELDPAEFN